MTAANSTKTTMSYTSVIMTAGRNAKGGSSVAPHTFAAKLTETAAAPSTGAAAPSTAARTRAAHAQSSATAPVTPQVRPPPPRRTSPVLFLVLI